MIVGFSLGEKKKKKGKGKEKKTVFKKLLGSRKTRSQKKKNLLRSCHSSKIF